jgi:hypothetical protein
MCPSSIVQPVYPTQKKPKVEIESRETVNGSKQEKDSNKPFPSLVMGFLAVSFFTCKSALISVR